MVRFMYTRPEDIRRLRNQKRRASRARNFPTNTCPASRHLHMIADALSKGQPYPMIDEEPQRIAENILVVLEALWKLRTETGWPTEKHKREFERGMARLAAARKDRP